MNQVSWLYTNNPRPDEATFHLRRMVREGFSKPYVKPTPAYRLIRAMLTIPTRKNNFFYMSLGEYTNYLVASIKEAIESLGVEKVAEIATAIRERAEVKDTPLITAEFLPRNEAAKILKLGYPVGKLLLYANIAREKKLNVTWGRAKKKAIEMAMNENGFYWNELQAIKYRGIMKKLLRLVHPKPYSKEIADIWGWVVKKNKPPTERIEAYKKVVRLAQEGKREEAVRLAIEYYLPWEVVRSRVGKLDQLPPSLVLKAAKTIMSGNDIALQARSLIERGVPEDAVISFVKWKSMSWDAASRAAIGLLEKGRVRLARAFAKKSVVPKRAVIDALFDWEPKRVILLLDASGSMSGTNRINAGKLLLNFYDIADKIYAFESNWPGNALYLRELSKHENPLETVEEYFEFIGGGTPLYDAIIRVVNDEKLGEEDLLIVVTDEQENASQSGVQRLCDCIGRTNVLLAIVTGYPTPMVYPCKGVVGVGVGRSFEMIRVAMMLLSMEKQLAEGLVRPEEVYKLFGVE